MRLKESMISCLSKDVIIKLNALGVKTVVDFVAEDPEALAVKIKPVICYKDILSIRRVLLAQYSASVLNGKHLHDDVVHSMAIIPTGCSCIDKLLGGGLYTGEVTELVGDAGSGKTQVCLQTAAHISTVNQQNVIFIDSGGNFDTTRVNDILEKRNLNEADTISALGRIKCFHAFDCFELLQSLQTIYDTCQKHADEFYSEVRLVIVDCVASVISPILGTTSSGGHGYMMQIARLLKSLAVDRCLTVLTTNNTVAGDGQTSRPALGRTWQYTASTRIGISCPSIVSTAANGDAVLEPAPYQRAAKLDKSPRSARGSEIKFNITDEGLTPND